MRKAVIDSTPLINLVHLGLASKLLLFFDVIYVPGSVQREVNRKHRFRYQLRKLYEKGIFQRCSSADVHSVRLLWPTLDEGEAEALVQAQEQEADVVIVDEERARRQIAFLTNLGNVGTVAILARLHLQGEAEETSKLVAKLRRDLRFRVTDVVVNEAIGKSATPI